MINRDSGSKMRGFAKRIIPAISVAAVFGLLLAGCSTTPPITKAQEAALDKVEMNFSLDQCEPIDVNLYRCPAVDKAICNPYYSGQLDCVRIGKKGNVFVTKAFED